VNILGNCEHKYCDKCLPDIIGHNCHVCKVKALPKFAHHDLFSTNFLEELKKFQTTLSTYEHQIDSEKKKMQATDNQSKVLEPKSIENTLKTYSKKGSPVIISENSRKSSRIRKVIHGGFDSDSDDAFDKLQKKVMLITPNGNTKNTVIKSPDSDSPPALTPYPPTDDTKTELSKKKTTKKRSTITR